MWNPFKRKFRVCIDDCINQIIAAALRDPNSYSLYDWLEDIYGVKRKWSWRTHKNYLEFNSEHDYMIFLLKL